MTGYLSFDTVVARGLPPFLGEPGIECAEDPEIFYSTSVDDIGVALAACSRCPHRAPCLQFAVDTNQRHGIWGGRTTPERSRILTRLGATG